MSGIDQYQFAAVALLKAAGGRVEVNLHDLDGAEIHFECYANRTSVGLFLVSKVEASRMRHAWVAAEAASKRVGVLVNDWAARHPEFARPPLFTGFKFEFGEPWVGQVLCHHRSGLPIYSSIRVPAEHLDDEAAVVSAAAGCLEKLDAVLLEGKPSAVAQ